MKTSEILLNAADVIVERGLNQDGEYAPLGADPATCPVCVIGAIRCVTEGDPRRWSAECGIVAEAFADWLRAAGRMRQTQGLPDWNDYDCKSAEQVITALREAAQAEQAAGR